MKKILIALDYNPAAQKVAETGQLLATALGADLILVHVIAEPAWYALEYSPVMGYQGAYTDNTAMLGKEIKEEASSFLAATASHLGNPSLKTMILEGDVEEALLDCAASENADLIVMGSHKHHGIDRILSPDLAVHLVKHSTIPVLSVPTLV